MPDFEAEPERYELREPPAYDFVPGRREFLQIAGVGLLVTVAAGEADGAPGATGRLLIGDDGTVTVFTGKVEVGQGARTELAMAVAEELGTPLDKIRVVMADTELVPVDGITAGSRTTPATVPAVRKAAAEARERLRPGSDAPGNILGKPHHRVDGRAIVTGQHRFPSDIRRTGMMYGAVLRAPSYGAKLQSIETGPVRNVTVVYDGTFAGCVGPTSFAARKGVEALAETAKWNVKPHPSSTELFEHLRKHADPSRGRESSRGSVAEALAKAAKTVRAEYRVPYVQHAPMEPRAAVAEWSGGKLTVWTGTQNPHGVRDQLAQAFHMPKDSVRVIVPDTGGGFGGKHTGEVAIEAARLARAVGRPVSLRWSRSEEFTWAYFRPAGLFEVEAALDAAGNLIAWDFLNVNAGAAAIETPYRVPNARTRFRYSQSPLREGSYRGIAATANNFARECFMDEIAGTAGADPVSFRLAHLDNERLANVLEAAARSFGWEKRPKGSGIACGTEKGSFVAACAEVEPGANGRVQVRRITMAFECGRILNPANLRAQVEGSIIQGLGGALTEEIRFENGRLLNGSFAAYPVPRFRDVPRIEVVLVDRPSLPPAGAGETPIIAVAPAIANAVYHATGARIRSMPVKGPA